MLKSEIQHYKKIRGDALSYDEKRKIASKIESVLYSFQHSRFLPNVQLKEKAVDEFESMIGELEKALVELHETIPRPTL
jgi:flagellin-specific chaperone FliS